MSDCNEHPDNKVVDGLVNKAMTDEWDEDRKVIEAFIATARDGLPAALDRIEELEAETEAFKAFILAFDRWEKASVLSAAEAHLWDELLEARAAIEEALKDG